jgi:hexosaminidase
MNTSLNGQTIPALIPLPADFKMQPGSFSLTAQTRIIADGEQSRSDAAVFNEYLQQFYGISLGVEVHKTYVGENVIFLEQADTTEMPDESYMLIVRNSNIKIRGTGAGVFYGLQTLRQLLPAEKKTSYAIPCVEISDKPRYKWRGMHLDVSRHFFGVDFVKKYIDELAFYKMNTFHWHLTDDQGWRIEIKKYPKLTSVGAWRKGTLIGHSSDLPEVFDTVRYGGFYTQDQIRDVVAYAAARHVTVVPEIEMPGHALAALAAYPELSCSGGPFEVEKKWGVFDDVFCPNDSTIHFLENVLDEVMPLFPGEYIHIGGDECPKVKWKSCPKCQSRIKLEKLKDEMELQSYFIKRIEQHVNSKGKQIIGWDEILEGGLAGNAAVMSWRGAEGGIAAAKMNHKVVMTPGGFCYFDYYQGSPKSEPLAIGGYTTVEKVYSLEPVPSELTPAEQKYIMGAQANLWTEYIATPEHAEYMVFPRICALSEVLWSPASNRDFSQFRLRLDNHFSLLDMMHINYSRALYEIKMNYLGIPDKQGILLSLTPPLNDGEIRYTGDGSQPGLTSELYTLPITIDHSQVINAVWVKDSRIKGAVVSQAFTITKSTGKNITLKNEPQKKYSNGGAFALVDGVLGSIPWNGKEWLGFLGKDLDATIDLGKTEVINSVSIDVLSAESSWIYLPVKAELYISDDGKSFKLIQTLSENEIKKSGRTIVMDGGKSKARYIKVVAVNAGIIAPGNPGEGNEAWLFADEIMIK